jgi:hypothetical protein
MSEYTRRADDHNWMKLAKLAPLILAVLAIISLLKALGARDVTLEVTAAQAASAEKRVTAVEMEQAIQRQMLMSMKETMEETRQDVKEIRRRLK